MNGAFLSNEPILLFLHGVGDGDPHDKWLGHLSESLDRLGYTELDKVKVIAPKYSHALKGYDDNDALPDMTIKLPVREAAKQNRRDFERRMGAVEFRLGRSNSGSGWGGAETVVNAAFGLSPFKAAKNYMSTPQIRALVLNRILGQLPKEGRIVIIGHSLGSVIAADLVRRLPVGLEVAGKVTIGSPLANGNFDDGKLRNDLKDPPANLGWWVNFWNVLDPVAAHRGVSSVFPWMVDFRIATKVDTHVHDAEQYLSNRTVAEAVGFGLFGSRSQEVDIIDAGFDIPLDMGEQYALAALRYSYLINARLTGEIQDRHTGALRAVQATTVDRIRMRNNGENRPMPALVARLAFDASDPTSTVPEPLPSKHMGKEDAVALLTTLAVENIIQPFEISIPKDKKEKVDKREEAMMDLAAEMGLGSKYGSDVFAAVKSAHEALSDGRPVNWVKWVVLGAGAAALVVATGGLVLAPAAGLAGAAAITSALASFGPGGMIGGLLTAGTLATAGGGGIAFSLASSGTSAETLEAVVERQLSTAILRKLQNLEPNPLIWSTLVQIESEVRRQHERLDEFSDETGPALTELKRKIVAVERALAYLRENGLEPVVVFSDEVVLV